MDQKSLRASLLLIAENQRVENARIQEDRKRGQNACDHVQLVGEAVRVEDEHLHCALEGQHRDVDLDQSCQQRPPLHAAAHEVVGRLETFCFLLEVVE